ncbi:MAG: hypothetical protein IJK31_08360 [Ruminococcus sp.]|nr:hypothetical protein [Ruminococcus sp.]
MKKIVSFIAIITMSMTAVSCGSTDSSSSESKSSAAAVVAEADTTEQTNEAETEKETVTEKAAQPAAEAPDSDYSPADLAGEWVQTDSFGNILTVSDDGSFSLKYEGGGSRFGSIKVEAGENPDGSKTYWYSFYESDGELWNGFVCPEKTFDTIYSEDGTTFVRNDGEKPLAPTVPEAKDLRDALAFADRLISGGAIETDENAEYTAADGTVYHKSVDNIYKTTADVKEYIYRYMTEKFVGENYDGMFGTEVPKCIDINGELYIEYRPIGGVYSFYDEDPVIKDSGDVYTLEIRSNDYGADTTVEVDVVKDGGSWKIDAVRDSF